MEDLKKKRTGVKARLTSLIRRLDSSDLTSSFVAVHEKYLEDISRRMCEIHEKMLEEVSDESEMNAIIEDYIVEETRVLDAKMKLCLGNCSPTPSSSHSQLAAEVRLPRLELPTFNGEITEWTAFADLFKAAVHDNSSLTDAQKMQYLKSALKDEAANVVKHLSVSEENYQESWELLRKRYENQRLIANSIVQRIIALPNVKQGRTLREVLDRFNEAERALKASLPQGNLWELIVSKIIMNCLDEETLQAWELSLKTTDVPPLREFIDFLEIRARVNNSKKPSPPPPTPMRCTQCKGNHCLRSCPKYEKLSVDQRWDLVKKQSLCRNCLSPKHSTYDCQSSHCRKCGKTHHTTLHQDKGTPTATMAAWSNSEVLLPTAAINAIDASGREFKVRVLIDSGSQMNIISRSTVRKLKLHEIPTKQKIQTVSGVCHLPNEVKIRLKKGNWNQTLRCYVSDELHARLPTCCVSGEWRHLKGLDLADPDFRKPQGIDIIIGMGVASQLWIHGLIKGQASEPVAQRSVLGWLISGPTKPTRTGSISFFAAEIKDVLQKFWEIEEIPSSLPLTKEEERVEEHFQSTVTRTPDNRYEVRYPFVEEPPPLGHSIDQAIQRFKRLEHLLDKNGMKQEYAGVITEYLRLGHMVPVDQRDTKVRTAAYYLPHHAVYKESSTTNLRVVFDGSAKTSNGKSLNDLMLNGPRLQEDLFHILIRFQMHPVALCADIEKMYRQIQVHPSHQKYQRLIWRNSREEPLQEFQLTTVTFGMKAAPYLAIRTLLQLAADEGQKYPQAAEVLRRDFYVDDLLSGAPSVEAARCLQQQLSALLQAGGFHLRKWCTNKPQALSNISCEESNNEMIPIKEDESVKTLGLHWNPTTDTFKFVVTLPPRNHHSKRTLLSDTARIFDPMGWLSPVTIRAKMMFQALWCLSLTWDEELPKATLDSWIHFRDTIKDVQNIQIPRCIVLEQQEIVSLCGFCDASQKAYGAVLYLRTERREHRTTKILVAKSKVAPLKPLSIPRLELCAAVLLSRLVKETRKALNKDVPTLLWTDSEIVLQWISQPAAKWKTFVANRVVQIHENTGTSCSWLHVATKENPADLISRGVEPLDLKSSELWWNGPEWLRYLKIPKKEHTQNITAPEARKIKHAFSASLQRHFMEDYSTLDKLLRITSWIKRFANRARRQQLPSKHLQVSELKNTLQALIRIAQNDVFYKEIQSLKNKRPISQKSSILSLAPFLDENNILRVGGRLQNADLKFSRKHQILLPPNHHLTSLILRHLHIINLHAGPQLLLNTARQRYWIPKGRAIVRLLTQKCTTCARQQACRRKQLMGNLPKQRITQCRPFLNCGVDYCGPFTCKETAGRGRYKSTHKAFIAVFVCMTTRAVHLEVVSSLSMESFLAALQRFVARRGLPSNIYSDNGRNFVAAQRHLKELYVMLQDEDNQESLHKSLASKNVQWHFIPPYSPHFGGLWEAAVKSLKYHLRRICGPNSFTFEELTTISSRIEACLNSRPIHPITEDVEDLEALTPGHFLIGQPLNACPEETIDSSTPINRLSRYRLLQRIIQDAWKKWKADYLNHLQTRSKWKSKTENEYHCGDLVVIKDPNAPPQDWRLGRISKISKDSAGISRVVTLTTARGTTQRTINQLVKLPVDD